MKFIGILLYACAFIIPFAGLAILGCVENYYVAAKKHSKSHWENDNNKWQSSIDNPFWRKHGVTFSIVVVIVATCLTILFWKIGNPIIDYCADYDYDISFRNQLIGETIKENLSECYPVFFAIIIIGLILLCICYCVAYCKGRSQKQLISDAIKYGVLAKERKYENITLHSYIVKKDICYSYNYNLDFPAPTEICGSSYYGEVYLFSAHSNKGVVMSEERLIALIEDNNLIINNPQSKYVQQLKSLAEKVD